MNLAIYELSDLWTALNNITCIRKITANRRISIYKIRSWICMDQQTIYLVNKQLTTKKCILWSGNGKLTNWAMFPVLT